MAKSKNRRKTFVYFFCKVFRFLLPKRVNKKMKFKACEARKTAAYQGVCEDFEGKRNAEIRFLFALYSENAFCAFLA